MGLKVTDKMTARINLLQDCLSSDATCRTITSIAEQYGVSRTMCYRLLRQFRETGSIEEGSRVPKSNSRQISEETRQKLISLRQEKPGWGSAKLRAIFGRTYPDAPLPCKRTVENVLKKQGLIPPRKSSQKAPKRTLPLTDAHYANHVWAIDFKGDFLTQDRRRCYPLTMLDHWSRYSLLIQHVPLLGAKAVIPIIIDVFQEYGLPEIIRSDGGPPFGSTGFRGWGKLSVFFAKLGITQERIDPGVPQQNGKLERIHRTLREATINPPAQNLDEQQLRFGRFQYEYNHIRPHESLRQTPPAEHYSKSLRKYPGFIPEVSYSNDFIVRKVDINGDISFRGTKIKISKLFSGEPVGLLENEEGGHEIYFGKLEIGKLLPYAINLS